MEKSAWTKAVADRRLRFGVHFDTFPPIKINRAKAKETFANARLEVFHLKAGETIEPC